MDTAAQAAAPTEPTGEKGDNPLLQQRVSPSGVWGRAPTLLVFVEEFSVDSFDSGIGILFINQLYNDSSGIVSNA